MLHQMMKSLIDQEKNPVLLCDLDCKVMYANPASVRIYRRDMTGENIKNCHNEHSNMLIDKMIAWLQKSVENNILFMYHNPKANQDVYMIALRDEQQNLIGFYEKHENRTLDTTGRPELYH